MNRIKDLLKIDCPIIMGGMAAVGKGDLPAAVSNAGGLGLIGGGGMSVDGLKAEIDHTRWATDNPWGVNIIAGSLSADAKVELLLKEKPPVVSLGGILRTGAITTLKEAGITVLAVVSSVKNAKRCIKAGADVIVVEGVEAGGHVSDQGLTTMVLTRLATMQLDKPVIAAGGIADGAGMAAALVLGAEGVQVGTGFVCAEESPVHLAVKEAFIKASEQATTVTGNRLKIRSIKNDLTANYQEIFARVMSGEAPLSELEDFESGKLKLAMEAGDVRNGYLMAGQGVNMVGSVRSAAAIVNEMMEECTNILAETLYRL